MKKFIYYFSCFMSGMVELGTILWGLSKGFSIDKCVLLAFAYQLGNVFLYFITKRVSRLMPFTLVISAALGILTLFLENNSTSLFIVSVFMYILLSTCIQLTRESVKSQVENLKKWKKRSFRVVGFFASAIMYTPAGTYILIACSAALFVFSFIIPRFGFDDWMNRRKAGEIKNPVCLAMITHQAHYFVYTYVLLALVFCYYKSPLIAAVWFVVNWIPYTITEPLVQKLKLTNYYAIGIIAHLFNGIILIAMWLLSGKGNILATVLLWMFTGFGGGNIFCVKKALAKTKEYDHDTWMFSEQLGHLLGMISCVLVIKLFNYETTMLVGAIFALITIPVIVLTVNQKKIKNAV